jgi:hypothetical protein
VLDGTKTQTRRPVKPNDYARESERPTDFCTAIYRNNRKLWEVGRQYAVIPGRGKHGVGFLKITNIVEHDVRNIGRADAIAEGFKDEMEFLQIWTQIYDPKVKLYQTNSFHPEWMMEYSPGKAMTYRGHTNLEATRISLCNVRPSELYRAYAIAFEIVKDQS